MFGPVSGMAVVWLALQATVQTQADPAVRAFELERRGLHPQAAELYRSALAMRPNDIGLLLGLERTLNPQSKLPEMLPEVQRALAGAEANAGLFGVAIRVYLTAGLVDSVRSIVDRWAKLEPANEGPYQEWGSAAIGRRDRPQAKTAYQLGRSRLGGDALAGELAQLATIEADYATAVTEWLRAVTKVSAYRSAAVSMLAQVPSQGRSGVLRHLEQARTALAERMAATLTIRWGDPVGGVRRVERANPLLGDQLIEAMQEALDETRGLSGREVLMARGIGLETLAAKSPAQSTRFLLDAAQAYADAGDQGSARRMLGKLATDSKASPTMAASATSTLVTVLVAEGKLEEATKRLVELRGVLPAEERQGLEIRVAEGWIRQGNLARAEQIVAQDSTIEGLALRGRIRLYLGDLGQAVEFFKLAGPYAGSRESAVSRATALALLQVIDDDSLPALGAALLKLERRDSLGATAELEALAGTLPPDRGGAETLLLAGRIRKGLGNPADAERLFRVVSGTKVPAAGAAAELELAHLMLADRKPLAIETLEHLLLAYPNSAVAPQARRLLDVAKGAVPPS